MTRAFPGASSTIFIMPVRLPLADGWKLTWIPQVPKGPGFSVEGAIGQEVLTGNSVGLVEVTLVIVTGVFPVLTYVTVWLLAKEPST